MTPTSRRSEKTRICKLCGGAIVVERKLANGLTASEFCGARGECFACNERARKGDKK